MPGVPTTTSPIEPAGRLRRSPASMGVLSDSSRLSTPAIDAARPVSTLSARAPRRVGLDAFLLDALPDRPRSHRLRTRPGA